MSRELELATALRPVLLRLNNAVRRQVPSAELTAAQCTALATVLDHGPLRMGELAERERVSMPTATSVICRMEKLGLVQRRPDPGDGRAVLVELTRSGRKRLEEVATQRNALIAGLLTRLDASQRDAIAAAVPALTAMLALDQVPRAEPMRTTGSTTG